MWGSIGEKVHCFCAGGSPEQLFVFGFDPEDVGIDELLGGL